MMHSYLSRWTALSLTLALSSAPAAAQDVETTTEPVHQEAAPTSEVPVQAPTTPDAALDAPPAASVGDETAADETGADETAAEETAAEESTEGETAAEEAEDAEEEGTYAFGGWAEAYYGYNFNQPSNGITDLRGFDNRHSSFNLSNVVLDAQWDWEGVNGRISLQWGSTGATYYLAETATPVLGSGVGSQSISIWQFVQQAYVGYRIPIGSGLNVQAGLFLSPIGVEAMAVRDNYLYSRSDLFYGFPFYHTGVRIAYALTTELSVSAMVINGWNTVTDNNDEKSFHLQVVWATPGLVTATLNYLGGVERVTGAAEGRAWRHIFDLNATITPTEWLGIQAQATGGFEPNAFGTSAYMAGALTLHFQLIEWLALNARGDFFWERVASNAAGTAASIFWPVEWVSSVTGGIDIRPHDHISFRIEYRHDHASGDAYYAGQVMGDGVTMPWIRNARSQDTLTIGTTAWFD